MKERRYVFDISDISSLIYACPHCGHEVTCKIDHEAAAPKHCPSCSLRLLRNGQESDPSDVLLINLRMVRRQDAKGVRVRLVVPDPD